MHREFYTGTDRLLAYSYLRPIAVPYVDVSGAGRRREHVCAAAVAKEAGAP